MRYYKKGFISPVVVIIAIASVFLLGGVYIAVQQQKILYDATISPIPKKFVIPSTIIDKKNSHDSTNLDINVYAEIDRDMDTVNQNLTNLDKQIVITNQNVHDTPIE